MGWFIASEVELTIDNRSSAIVGILDVAGARGTTQLASIENARSLDCAQVSDSVHVLGEVWQGIGHMACTERYVRNTTPAVFGRIWASSLRTVRHPSTGKRHLFEIMLCCTGER